MACRQEACVSGVTSLTSQVSRLLSQSRYLHSVAWGYARLSDFPQPLQCLPRVRLCHSDDYLPTSLHPYFLYAPSRVRLGHSGAWTCKPMARMTRMTNFTRGLSRVKSRESREAREARFTEAQPCESREAREARFTVAQPCESRKANLEKRI